MINDILRTPTGNLDPLYQRYERQKCFIGYSPAAPWGQDLVETCNEVLAEFDMDPWYESEHFDPTQSLRDKVIEMIANTRCGIYDISHWRKDNKGEWHLPCNVFIELGIAIALNRPLLMLRHTNNTVAQLRLPECLESVTALVEFKSLASLKQLLRERLTQWQKTDPQKDWWNRYCTFGNRSCEYRETHPHLRQWGQEKLDCHISDGPDDDQVDFREVIESVLGNFDNVAFRYLDWLPTPEGYSFQLCGLCQAIRSSPFAIYRISEQTRAETYMAIGMSLALETQFEQKIPKIVRTSSTEDIPSLLAGYDVVLAQDRTTWRKSLRVFTPQVIRQVRKSTWKARPLPFIEVKPGADEQLASAAPAMEESDDYLARIGKYGVIKELERSEMTVTYLVRDTENDQLYTMKRLHSSLASDSRWVTRFHREADMLCRLAHPHILHGIEQGEDGIVPYVVIEHFEGQALKQLMRATGPMEVARALNYAHQVAEGLDAAFALDIAHKELGLENILVDSQDQVKIAGFGAAYEHEVDERGNTQTGMRRSTPVYSIAPEQLESARYADIRSDLYSLAVVFFHMLTKQFPFEGEFVADVAVQHINAPIPSLCRQRPDLLGVFDLFLQKAMAKSPADRYQTPAAFLAAFEHLQQAVALAPPGNRTLMPMQSETPTPQGIPPLVGTTLGQYRLFDALNGPFYGAFGDTFKAFDLVQDRTVTITVFPISDETKAVPPTLDEGIVQELRTLTALSHPNLVPLYDFGIHDNQLYSVEEYIEGGPLKERLATVIRLQQAVAYVLQAAEGLAYLHAHDLVYPIVRPEIMVLRSDDHLVLPYWHIFKALKTIVCMLYPTQDAEIEAELAKIEGLEVTPSSNTYSLGITLVECLTSGRRPLAPGYDSTLRIWDLRAAHVPVELQQIAVKMTCEEPKERYQSMSEVIDALQAAQATLASTEQAPQEEQAEDNHTVGMERCAFCNAATTSEDERCSNCGNRLLPELTPTWGQPTWGQQPVPAWGQQANPWGTQPPGAVDSWGHPGPPPPYNPKATRKLNICPFCSEDFQLGATVCSHCGKTLHICPNCGAEYRPGDHFCLNCGYKLTPYFSSSIAPSDATIHGIPLPSGPFAPQVRYCPTCGAATSSAAFCEQCGRPRPTVDTCPFCRAITQPGDVYCMNCGGRLGAPTQYLPSQGWGAPASQPSPDPWAAPPAPDSWAPQPSWGAPSVPSSPDPYLGIGTTGQLSNTWAPRPAPSNAWGVPPPVAPPSGAQEVPTVIADNANKQVPPSDLTGQFNTGWTSSSVRSTFTRDDLNNIGKTFGDYRTLREIGQGGLGRVYLALHTTSYQQAAVKLFYSHLSAKQYQQLFFLETQVLDHLRHPYILPIIAVNLREEPRYLITDYAPHGSLHERIQSGQPLPLENTVTILTQVGEALAHIHQHNIVHRDLKPGNILFNEADEALLSDFDIAVVLDEGESKTVDNWGSPPYMAPEQFNGMVSRKSDQYALGCIAYKLVTGRRPFDDSHFVTLQFKHSTQQPIAPRRLNPTLPAYIEHVILKAMAKDPANRFADMRAFLDALRAEPELTSQWRQTAPTAPLALTDGAWGQPGQDMPVTQQALAAGNNTQPARVLVEIDGKIVSELPLSKPWLTVGRLPANDIVVPGVNISRLHANIYQQNGIWLIEDANSLNGIAYQGKRVERQTLKSGDRILLAPGTALSFILRTSI
jgi:serine/threonine protein kinase